MHIHADFSRPAIVAAEQYQWQASPQNGVERVMLDRIGAEQARATSIVRYAPGAYFPRHAHPGGEEILVLCGTFSDERQDFPAGWYLRNPPGSSHQPYSAEGAVIFVKLRQMSASEADVVQVNTADPATWQQQGRRSVCELFDDGHEQVRILRCAALEPLWDAPPNGAELLVLAGSVRWQAQDYGASSWLRLPATAVQMQRLCAGADGATIYLKSGHLPPMEPMA
ncbi:anti-sigma factor [Lampropedia aestuarii]|uniref:Anti-sigma factor n=1 Tax=Lampropedia aestuarii TaxID=2562762 RepID=A0A4S5BS13_9BURK|nr:cupin domain-containing protein [Lampropedia aestuarii]THJ35587.1 anti-sigma factor [Lampropedia aestuarii]